MPANQAQPTKLSLNAFIDELPDQAKRADAKAPIRLMQSATGEKPHMWGRRLSALVLTNTSMTAGARAICR